MLGPLRKPKTPEDFELQRRWTAFCVALGLLTGGCLCGWLVKLAMEAARQ